MSNFPFLPNNVICLDFEAGAIGEGSYPIEVGIVDVYTTETEAWLIHPTQDWIDDGLWNERGVAIHNIPFVQLMSEGQPVETVANELMKECQGKIVLSDAPSYDRYWLHRLYEAVNVPPPFELNDFQSYAFELAAKTGRRPDIAYFNSQTEALIRYPHIHRAVPDARGNAEIIRLIAGCP